MSDVKLFKDIRLGEKPLNKCLIAYKSKDIEYRLYVEKIKSIKVNCYDGFYAIAVEYVCSSNGKWEDDDLEIIELFKLEAYFDGVRHMHFNRDAGGLSGYWNYPNLKHIIKMLEVVREIELQCCYECEK